MILISTLSLREPLWVSQTWSKDAVSYLEKLTTLSLEANVDQLDRESITVFHFISSCSDQRLREKIFESKRRDLTEVRRIVGQHVLQQRSESTISEHVQVVMAIKPKAKPKHFRIKTMEELKGRCLRGGKASHKAEDYHIFRNKLSCHNCVLEGHLSPVCMGGKCQNGPKRTPVNAVTEQEISAASLEVPRFLSHSHGSFKYLGYPDTGSATTLMSTKMAARHDIKIKHLPTSHKLVPVKGDPLNQDRVADITITTSFSFIDTSAIVTPSSADDLIIGYGDLKRLRVILRSFPETREVKPVHTCPQVPDFCAIWETLIKEYPEVLSDTLPDWNKAEDLMKIHIKPGEIRPTKVWPQGRCHCTCRNVRSVVCKRPLRPESSWGRQSPRTGVHQGSSWKRMGPGASYVW